MTRAAARPASVSQGRIALRMVGRSIAGAFAALRRALARLLRRADELAEPVTSVISTIGWLVLGAALVSFVVALVFDWVEFAFLGATLVGAMLVAVPFVFGRMHYRVGVELQPHRVVAGERALGRISVVNDGTTTSVPSRMELPVGAGLAEFRIPALEPGAEHDELFAVPTARRAVIVAGPAISIRGDELGLLRRTVRWSDPVELFVHPRTARLKPSAAGLVKDLEGEVTRTITDHDISFHALRAYEPGDPLRNVHWRSSARTGQLMVRQYEETRRSELVLVQATAAEHYLDDEEFELGVSVFASLGVQVVRDTTTTVAATEDRSLRTTTATALLDDSCRIEPRTSSTVLREFVRDALRRAPSASVVIAVVGSALPLAELRATATVLPADAVLLVFRVDRTAEARISRVGSTAVATIGELAELPAVVRRVRP